MKRLFLLAVFVGLLASPVLAQRNGDQGYGLMFGNPSGFSTKFWLDDTWALDGAIGVARGEFDIHMDLLRHSMSWHDMFEKKWDWFQRLLNKGNLPVYIGVGPRLLFEEKEEFGIRVPLGVSFFPHESNWEVFTEVAPVLRLTPNTGFNGDFGIGVRYYFKSIRPRIK